MCSIVYCIVKLAKLKLWYDNITIPPFRTERQQSPPTSWKYRLDMPQPYFFLNYIIQIMSSIPRGTKFQDTYTLPTEISLLEKHDWYTDLHVDSTRIHIYTHLYGFHAFANQLEADGVKSLQHLWRHRFTPFSMTHSCTNGWLAWVR